MNRFLLSFLFLVLCGCGDKSSSNNSDLYNNDESQNTAVIKISGRVTCNWKGLSGVKISLNGDISQNVITDINGEYLFNDVQNGLYTISAYLPDYTISNSLEIKVDGSSLFGVDFTATPIKYTRCLAATPWPAFKGNNQRTGLSNIDTSYNDGTLKWTSFKINNYIEHPPAIGIDGTIYIGGGVYLRAFNTDGTLKWDFYIDGGAIYVTPAIGDDGVIYFATTYGKLFALNPDGTLKWKYLLGKSVSNSLAIDDHGIIYLCAGYSIYAFYPNGTLKWIYSTDAYTSESSPAIGYDNTIYFGSRDCNLYALNPNGTLLWKFTTDGEVGTPALGKDGTIYLYSSYYLFAINSDGTFKWKKYCSQSSCDSPSIGKNGTIYFKSWENNDSYLTSVNPDGTLNWKVKTLRYTEHASPTIGYEGTIYFCGAAYNPDGSVKWFFPTNSDDYWERGWSSPVIGLGGTIYLATRFYLHAFGG